MLPLARAAPFIVLLALGIAYNALRGTKFSRVARLAFIAWFVIASCAAGLLQHDFWPFSSFSVIPESAGRYREGTWYEARLEPFPLSPSVTDKWIERVFIALPADRKDAAARFLLQRASDLSCSNRKLLGPLAAPNWLLRPAAERQPRSLRIDRATWQGRTLVYELR